MPLQRIDGVWTRGTYIMFRNLGKQFNGSEHKTNLYEVLTQDNFLLGKIKWFPRWRKYAFNSMFDSNVYEEVCLEEIAQFLREETKAHRANHWSVTKLLRDKEKSCSSV